MSAEHIGLLLEYKLLDIRRRNTYEGKQLGEEVECRFRVGIRSWNL